MSYNKISQSESFRWYDYMVYIGIQNTAIWTAGKSFAFLQIADWCHNIYYVT